MSAIFILISSYKHYISCRYTKFRIRFKKQAKEFLDFIDTKEEIKEKLI
ncbi:hypothetical protein [Borreliella burgdorferi]|nr:hypothetical protein [Borreliella burgdorferi]QYM88023.1 hypothetical protein KGA77_05105 [Borreliella burgdorferi]UUX90789.1 hypothetical protein MTX41_05690 [Borreliella burgdorferi]